MADFDALRSQFMEEMKTKSKLSDSMVETFKGYLDEFKDFMSKSNIPPHFTGMDWAGVRKKYVMYLRDSAKTTGGFDDKVRLVERFVNYSMEHESTASTPVSKDVMTKGKSKTGSYVTAIIIGILWIVIAALMVAMMDLSESTKNLLNFSIIGAILLVVIVIFVLASYMKKK
jgi:uncharacterized membrane protein YeaQ/YmgE (transglycosylase-associated protein family)